MENEREVDLKNLENFIKELRTVYAQKRMLLKDVPEENLSTNEDFNVCMKIAAVLASVNSTKVSFDTFFILAKDQCDFKVEKLLNLFEIKWKEENGIKIPELVSKEDEQI